jgi:transcriptional regulator with XRE-family HTH domain
MNHGKALNMIRKSKQVTQMELHQLTGLSQAALSNIERGDANPHPSTIKKICAHLGVPESLWYVLGLEKEEIPEENRHLYDKLFPVIESLCAAIIK